MALSFGPGRPAEAGVSGFGGQLRAARAARGCSLLEAERQTRIRARLLAALEAEDLAAFASPAQARGFLRNYAEFLGLDAADLVAQLNGPGRPAAARASARPGATPRVQGGWRRIFTRDLFIGVTFTMLFGLLLGWGAVQLWASVAAPGAAATPTRTLAAAPAAGGTAAGAATATLPPEATPTAPLPTPRPNYVGVNLLVRAEQRTWLRVSVDGAETFVGQLTPGQTREFVGNTMIEVWTGNGRGTRVIFNGQDQGVLGDLGEVVIRLWTLDGAVTPTPAPTATP